MEAQAKPATWSTPVYPLAVSENRQLGRLTLRQREMLAAALEAKAVARAHRSC